MSCRKIGSITLTAATLALLAPAAVGQDTEAKCIVRLYYNPEYFVMSPVTVQALLESAGVAGAAARKVSNGNPDPGNYEVSFSPFEEGGFESGNLIGVLSVRAGDNQGNAFLSAVCDQLQSALRATQQRERERADKLQAQLESYLREIEGQYEQLQQRQLDLCAAAGRADLSRERVISEISELEREREELMGSLMAVKAREEAVADQIARIAKAVETVGAQQEVLEQLTKVVELRHGDVERTQKLKAAGQASDSELTSALEAEAVARAELASRRADFRREAGGEQLAVLNRELMSLTIDSAEKQARLKYVDERLKNIKERKLLELANQYQAQVMLPLELVQARLEQASRELAEFQSQRMRDREAEVTVIGAAPETPK